MMTDSESVDRESDELQICLGNEAGNELTPEAK